MATTKSAPRVTIPLEVARLLVEAVYPVEGKFLEDDDDRWDALRALRGVGSRELTVAVDELIFSALNVDFNLGGDDNAVNVAKSGLGVHVKSVELNLDAERGLLDHTAEDTDALITEFNSRSNKLVDACGAFQPNFLRIVLIGSEFGRRPYFMAFAHKFLDSVRKLLSSSFQSVTSVVIRADPESSPLFLHGLEPYLNDRVESFTLEWQDGNGPREKMFSRPQIRTTPIAIMPASMSELRILEVDGAHRDDSDPFPGELDKRGWLPPKLIAKSLDQIRYPCLVLLALSNLNLRRKCLPNFLASCAGTLREMKLTNIHQKSAEWMDTFEVISTSRLTTLYLKGPLCIKQRLLERPTSRRGKLKQIIFQVSDCYREFVTDLLIDHPGLTDLCFDGLHLHQHPDRAGQPLEEWSVVFEHIQKHCKKLENIVLQDARDRSGPVHGNDSFDKAVQLVRQNAYVLLDPRIEPSIWQLSVNSDPAAIHSLGSLLRSIQSRTGSLAHPKVMSARHVISLAPLADVKDGKAAPFESRSMLAQRTRNSKVFVIPLTPVQKSDLEI